MNLELTGNKWITGTKPKWKFQGAMTVYANSVKVHVHCQPRVNNRVDLNNNEIIQVKV